MIERVRRVEATYSRLGRRKSARMALLRKESGFTLLEILIATFIFSITVGALYVAFHSALTMRENTHERLAKELPKRQAVSVIKKDLCGLLPSQGTLIGEMTGTRDEEEVRLDSIEFTTSTGLLGSNEPWGDVQKVRYYLEDLGEEDSEKTNQRDLIREVTRNLLASVEEEPETERLLQDVKSLTLTYYDGESWLESWDSTTAETGLPEAVRFEIAFPVREEGRPADRDVEILIPVSSKKAETGESDAG